MFKKRRCFKTSWLLELISVYCTYGTQKWGDIVSPRTGRPVAGEPKNNDVKVRLDDTTHKLLLDYCEKNKVTKAEAIRQGIHLLLSQK